MATKKTATKKKPAAKKKTTRAGSNPKKLADAVRKGAGLPNTKGGRAVADAAVERVIPGVAEARDMAKSKKGGKPRTFMDEQAEDDRTDAKTKESQGDIKRAHAMVREANNRLTCAQLETTTEEAIRHDVERTREVLDIAREELKHALEVMAR